MADKIKCICSAVWGWLKSRWIGFYLLIPVAVLNLVIPFVYMSGFFGTEYQSNLTFALPFIATASLALAFFRPTARYASVVMFILELASLLMFVSTAYMHLTTVFFGGITGNVFKQAGFPFSFCTMALLVNIIICIVAMCFSQYKGDKSFFAGPDMRMSEQVNIEEGNNG